MKQKCAACKFWNPQLVAWRSAGEYVEATCQRHSPVRDVQLAGYGGGDTQARWPKTRASDWCGDWAEWKPEEQP